MNKLVNGTMEYFVGLLLFAVFVLMSLFLKDHPFNRVVYYFLAFVVAFFIGMRGMLDEYSIIFRIIPPLSEFFDEVNLIALQKGFLFALICSVLQTLNLGSQSLLLLFAMTSVGLHAYYYRKFTPYYFLAFLIYMSHEIIFHEWVPIRAGLASALVLPMIYFIVQNRRRNFYLLVLLSTFIQYVAILSITLKFLNRKISSKYLVIALLLGILFAGFNGFSKTLTLFSQLGLLPGGIELYVESKSYGYDVGLGHAKTLQQVLLVFLALFLRRKAEHPSPYFNVVLNTYWLSTMAYIVFSDLAIYATRIGGHFYVVEPILVVFLSRYFVEKKTYALGVMCGSLLIGFLNYVVRVQLDPYSMFVKW